jgi:hypothetical protein
MTRRKTNSRRTLSFQSLENRNLMAGNLSVSVQNHSLVINGDNNDNYVQIEQAGNGQYTVTAYSGDKINGKTGPQTFSGVTSDFKIDLKGGKDAVSFGGDVLPITLPHNVSIKNTESIFLDQAKVLDNLSISGGTGGDYIDIKGSTIEGGLSMDVGSGYSLVRVEYTHIGDPSVNGGQNDFNFKQGNGGLFLDLEYTTVERDMNVKLDGSSHDTKILAMFGGVVGRNLTFQGDDEIDSVSISEYTVGKNVSISTGNGNDHVALGGDDTTNGLVVTVPPSAMSADQIFVDLGKGNDILQLGGDGTHNGGGALANKATYIGGDGVDQVLNESSLALFGTFSQFESMPPMLRFLTTPVQLAAVTL